MLLADRVQEQRVHAGVLGCPGCGARYPVRAGFADLRTPDERAVAGAEGEDVGLETGRAEARAGGAGAGAIASAADQPAHSGPSDEAARRGTSDEGAGAGASVEAVAAAATRLAALIGMERGLGARHALVVGPAASAAAGMAALVPESEVVAAGPGVSRWEEAAGVSRIALGRAMPFGSGTLRGVALTGPAADALLEEGVRVLGLMGRLLLEPAPADAAERLAQVGARVVAREGEAVVAVRVGVG